jgi:hypothetical protein
MAGGAVGGGATAGGGAALELDATVVLSQPLKAIAVAAIKNAIASFIMTDPRSLVHEPSCRFAKRCVAPTALRSFCAAYPARLPRLQRWFPGAASRWF